MSWKGCWQEIVLTDYTEAELLAIDPKLVVLAPFTVDKNTDKAVLFEKGSTWQNQVKQAFPNHQQPKILDILGLLVLDRFSKLTYEEVRTMLNLDLSKSVAVRQMRQMARAKGRAEGRVEGLIEDAREMVLEALDERFGPVPKPLFNQLQQIQQHDVLKTLHRQALRCQTLTQFRKLLVSPVRQVSPKLNRLVKN